MKRRDFSMLVPYSLGSLFAPLSATRAAHAVERPDIDAILSVTDRARGGGLPGIVWKVEVKATRAGSEQTRLILVKAKADDSLVEFLQPAKVAGQKLLSRGHNLWFIRPGLQKAVPISPRQRLLGEAANGDIASTNYTGDYKPRLLRSEAVGGDECHVLELSAAEKGVTYDKIHYFVSKSRQLGVKAEFYSVSGKLFKTATFQYENTITHQGKPAPFISLMTIDDALEIGARTSLRYREAAVADLPASTFNLDLLSR